MLVNCLESPYSITFTGTVLLVVSARWRNGSWAFKLVPGRAVVGSTSVKLYATLEMKYDTPFY
jgi:hypothetical protein